MAIIQLPNGKRYKVDDDKAQEFESKGATWVDKPVTREPTLLERAADISATGLQFGVDVLKETAQRAGRSLLAPVDMISTGFGGKTITPKFLGGSQLDLLKQKSEAARGKGASLELLDYGLELIAPLDIVDVYGLANLPKDLTRASTKRIAQIQAKKQLAKEAREEAERIARKKAAITAERKAVREGAEKRGNELVLRAEQADVDLTKQTPLRKELDTVRSKIKELERQGVGKLNDVISITDQTNLSPNVLDLRLKEAQNVIKEQDKLLKELVEKESKIQKQLLKDTYNVKDDILDVVYSKPTRTTGKKASKDIPDDFIDTITNSTSKSLMKQGVKENETGWRKVYNENLVSMVDVFNKMGDAGREMTRRIFLTSDNAAIRTGEMIADYDNLVKNALKVSNFSKDELGKHLVDILEDGIRPINESVDELAQYIRQTNNYLADEATSLGVKMKAPNGEIIDFVPRDNFFPHMYDYNDMIKVFKKGGKKKDEFLKSIADKNKTSLAEAERMFNKFIGHNHKRFVGSLQHTRSFDIPNYRTDLKAITDYWEQANLRLEEIKNFGNFDEKADALLKKIGEEGGDFTFARKMWERITGQDVEDKIVDTFWSKVRSMNAITLLDTTAVTQLAQLGPTMQKFGVWKTLSALTKSALKPSKYRNYALRQGTLLNAANEFANTQGTIGSLYLNKISGIGKVDEFMRTVSTEAAKPYVNNNIRKIIDGTARESIIRDFKRIKTIDVDGIIKRGKMSEEEFNLAVKYIVDKTQVRARKFELPISWTSETGKTLTQLKSFTFSFQRYLKEDVYEEALKGNFIPLMRLGVATQVTGEGIADIKALITNRERPEGALRVLENWGYGLTLGMIFEVVKAAQYGAGAVTSAITGPTVSGIGEAGANFWQLIVKQNPDPTLKMMLRRIPLIGSTLKGIAYPPKR